MFRLTDKQIEALQKYRTRLEEKDKVKWHEDQKSSSTNFKQKLVDSGFEHGKDLSLDELRKIGELLSVGLGSTALAMRGKTSMFEANDLKTFNEKLRILLYSAANLAERIDGFLGLKFVGVQTASQFLCKFDYEKYPFFAQYMVEVSQALSINETQLKEASIQSLQEFGLPSEGYDERTYKYFQYCVILKEIKNGLKLADYLEVQNVLWLFYERLKKVIHAFYAEKENGFYIDESIVKDEHRGVLFDAGKLCMILEQEYGIPFDKQTIDGWTGDFEEEAAELLKRTRGKEGKASKGDTKAGLMQVIEEFREWRKTSEATCLLASIDKERVEVQQLLERLNSMDKASKDFTDLVLYGLLPYYETKSALRVSVFPAFRNIRKFFEPYGYDENDWKNIAQRIFDLAWGFKNNPESLDHLIKMFASDERYSRRLQTGSLSPIIFCLSDKFPVINNRVRRSFELITGAIGQRNELEQKMEHYLGDAQKIRSLISELGVKDFENLRVFDMFCFWLDSNYISKDRTLPMAPEIVIDIQQLSKETYLPVDFFKNLESLLRDKGQVILYGPPGTGKTFIAEEMAGYLAGSEERIAKVQFHPSYSYEDFVEGLKPKISDGKLSYDIVPGIFKKFCDNATNMSKNYVFIVDEINRGSIPKIFGELVYCLEYRKCRVHLQYSGKSFTIPSNIYVIATMNSADRSIALVDYALRRRFYFEELLPSEQVLSKYLAENNCKMNMNNLITFFHKMNDKIEQKLGKEYCVGHSYFMIKEIDKNKVEKVWKYAVYPLLEEYFFHNKSELEEFENDFKAFMKEA